MAGDWIKWEHGLIDKPEVIRMSATLSLGREIVVCRLMKFWEWCDANIPDNAIQESGSAFVSLSPRDGDNVAFIDALVGTPKFADSLAAVDWIRFRDGRIELPNFGRHNGETAKTRARNAKNQKKKRSKPEMETPPKTKPHKTPSHRTVTEKSPGGGDKTVTRGEESREEKEEEKTSAAEPQLRTPHAEAIFQFGERWRRKYGVEYPFSGRDGKAVKEVLQLVGSNIERLKPILDRFFLDDDPFHAAESRHAWPKLHQNFARWLVEGKSHGQRVGAGQHRGPDPSSFNADVIKKYADPRAAGPAGREAEAVPNRNAPTVGPTDDPGAAEPSEGGLGKSEHDIPF